MNALLSLDELAQLRRRLDWRERVDDDAYPLDPRFATNFYGVAFSIARLRFLLGWEEARHSQRILSCLLAHYHQHSRYGFADETAGMGRFDHYSVLLIAEICQRHEETGLPVSAELKASLRHAARLALAMTNDDGVGFLWGRSIGAYGDSAFNEILAVALRLGVLTPEARGVADAFALACSRRFLTFRFDAEEQSVNLWFHGRRTDAYRADQKISA